jgi:ATP-dependent helicase HrpB
MNRLITVAVSRAAAEQRKGRAGRLGPGVCYRLYSRHAFQTLIPFAPPEMLVSDLSSLVLELGVWGVKDPADLSWLDPPPAPAWETAKRLLLIWARWTPRRGNPMGHSMARLPLHPRLGRLLRKRLNSGTSTRR